METSERLEIKFWMQHQRANPIPLNVWFIVMSFILQNLIAQDLAIFIEKHLISNLLSLQILQTTFCHTHGFLQFLFYCWILLKNFGKVVSGLLITNLKIGLDDHNRHINITTPFQFCMNCLLYLTVFKILCISNQYR